MLDPRDIRRRRMASTFDQWRSTPALIAALALLLGCNGYYFPEHERLADGDIRLERLSQPENPPQLIARDESQIEDRLSLVGPNRLAELMADLDTRSIEGAQLPLFFKTSLGRAYLRAGPGRALARGEPAESCPTMLAELDAESPRQAADMALRRCLAASGATCGCQLLAMGDTLLAPGETFEYPSSAPAHVYFLSKGRRTEAAVWLAEDVISDDVISNLAPDAAADNRMRLVDAFTRPVGELILTRDGRAELTSTDGPVRRGRWRAEGFRRGRLALSVALGDDDAWRAVLLIGYDPAEIAQRGDALRAGARSLFNGG